MSIEEVQRFNSPRGWRLVAFLVFYGAATLWGCLLYARFGQSPWMALLLVPSTGFYLTGQTTEMTLGDHELTRRCWRDALRGRPGATYRLDGGIRRARNGECTAAATRLRLGRLPAGAIHAIQRQGIEVQGELPWEPGLAWVVRLSGVCLFVVAAIVSVIAPDWWLALIPLGIAIALAFVLGRLGVEA